MRLPTVARWINVLITFHLTLAAWVFFRARTVGDAFTVHRRILTTPWHWDDIRALFKQLPTSALDITILFVLLFLLIDPVIDAWIKGERRMPSGLAGMVVFALLIACTMIFGWFGDTNFIYFQF